MKTDIQIAQEAVMEPITEVAARLGIDADDLELYGKYKAKILDSYLEKRKGEAEGKLILVTAINPTPAGEGKTTTSVGLGQALGKMGKRVVIALRELSPSLPPSPCPRYVYVPAPLSPSPRTDCKCLYVSL